MDTDIRALLFLTANRGNERDFALAGTTQAQDYRQGVGTVCIGGSMYI